MNKQITTLYNHFKNTPKKLKIICDWDEVIQPCEPYALWKLGNSEDSRTGFSQAFKDFWEAEKDSVEVVYSPYGSSLNLGHWWKFKEKTLREQQEIKNSPDFYQSAPFLTIAEDLLKLIKEDKVEQIIFLSAYDKRKFPNGDLRKLDIFALTFALFGKNIEINCDNEQLMEGGAGSRNVSEIRLHLIGFGSETQGQSKADWIKKNASDFDIVIDDNPNICRNVVNLNICGRCFSEALHSRFKCPTNPLDCKECPKTPKFTVLTPYYPAIENQHDERILLVKNEVNNLKKEDFQ